MRIIGGRFKGAKLHLASKGDFRPTSSVVKEALFNIIADKVAGSTFLDLYAGSCAVGVEAFSRGSKSVTFVDKILYQTQISKIREITGDSFIELRFVKSDVVKFLESTLSSKMKYDIIFADPPWGDPYDESLFQLSLRLLSEGGVFIVESYKKSLLPAEDTVEGLGISVDKRRYGDTKLSFYQKI
ncbi:MAG: RsmD family RNA methyltransferase [Nitrospinota bacterium]